MPSINNLTLTATAPDGEVIAFDSVLLQNIGRAEIASLRFTATSPEGTFFSAVFALGATIFDAVSGPVDNVAEADGTSLRFASLEFTGTIQVRLTELNPDGTPARDADGFPVRDTVSFPVNVVDDRDGAPIERNPDIVLGADPAPVDPAPVDPEPVDPAPVDPEPVDPAPVDPAPINVINGTGRGDRIEGTAQADDINGGRGNDVINGRGGDDIINGGAGRDVIRGGAGNDDISGGDGRDVIRGGAGDDTIDGGRGNDVMFGGRGADTFVFGANSDSDVIRDFSELDVIDLSDVAALNSFEDVSAALTQVRRGTELDLGDGNSVLLRDVNISTLDADDFLF